MKIKITKNACLINHIEHRIMFDNDVIDLDTLEPDHRNYYLNLLRLGVCAEVASTDSDVVVSVQDAPSITVNEAQETVTETSKKKSKKVVKNDHN